MIVRVISNFVKACAEAYKERLNIFCENFIKCEDTIKTLGSANKGGWRTKITFSDSE